MILIRVAAGFAISGTLLSCWKGKSWNHACIWFVMIAILLSAGLYMERTCP